MDLGFSKYVTAHLLDSALVKLLCSAYVTLRLVLQLLLIGFSSLVMFETEASAVPEDAPSFFKSAASYYGTKRGNHARSDQRVPPSSYDLMIGYDSFNYQHLISPRPLLMIAGSEAETLHYSKTAVEGAKEPKEFFVVKGKNHFDLYDDLTESAPKLVEFYANALAQ